jgi:multicomponent Na+:H+ antiporter subunit E
LSYIRLVLLTLALFGLWCVLSGHFNSIFLTMGAFSAIASVFIARYLQPEDVTPGTTNPPQDTPAREIRKYVRFAAYLPKLALEVVRSNFHIAYVVLSFPRLPIRPLLVRFDSPSLNEVGEVLLAQSITLTPGTVTIDVQDHKFIVHALTDSSRQSLVDGTLQKMVGGIFGASAIEVGEVKEITNPEDLRW